MKKTRREHDSLGTVEVPEDRLWGAQTQRSLENFPIGRGRFVWGRTVVRAFGILKKAAAQANAALGEMQGDKAAAIRNNAVLGGCVRDPNSLRGNLEEIDDRRTSQLKRLSAHRLGKGGEPVSSTPNWTATG